jgi:hypothetical protein
MAKNVEQWWKTHKKLLQITHSMEKKQKKALNTLTQKNA